MTLWRHQPFYTRCKQRGWRVQCSCGQQSEVFKSGTAAENKDEARNWYRRHTGVKEVQPKGATGA